MAETILHINMFIQNRSMVPRWHPSDYWPRRSRKWIIDHKRSWICKRTSHIPSHTLHWL